MEIKSSLGFEQFSPHETANVNNNDDLLQYDLLRGSEKDLGSVVTGTVAAVIVKDSEVIPSGAIHAIRHGALRPPAQ